MVPWRAARQFNVCFLLVLVAHSPSFLLSSQAISADELSGDAKEAFLKKYDAELPEPPEYHPDISTVVQLSWKPR